MTDTPPANPAFNAAGGSLSPAPKTQAVIVDVQLGCVKYMSLEDACNYLSALGETVENFRTRGIPVNWVAIGRTENFSPPEIGPGSDGLRARDQLSAMGFFEDDLHNTGDANESIREIFEKFIATHGPRRNEAVFEKMDFSALKPAPLTNHLQGSKNILTMGMVGSVCALETSIDGVQQGFNTSLLLDRVACWSGEGRNSQLLWREGFDTPVEAETWHRAEMKHALAKPERGFSDTDREAAAQIVYTTSDNVMAATAKYVAPFLPPGRHNT